MSKHDARQRLFDGPPFWLTPYCGGIGVRGHVRRAYIRRGIRSLLQPAKSLGGADCYRYLSLDLGPASYVAAIGRNGPKPAGRLYLLPPVLSHGQ